MLFKEIIFVGKNFQSQDQATTRKAKVLNSQKQFYLLQKYEKMLFNSLEEYKFTMKQKSEGNSYKLSQVFGFKGNSEKVHEEDVISVVKFDQSGSLITLGDKAGRIIIFRQSDSNANKNQFQYYTEFQGFSRRHDPLLSKQIRQQILDISWMRAQGQYLKFIVMNAKTIKILKVFEKYSKKIKKNNDKKFSIPQVLTIQADTSACVQKVFENRQKRDLVALNHSANQEYIFSSDRSQTLMWSLQKPMIPYIIVDLDKNKPTQEQQQNLTCATIHPTSDNIFSYGTDRGALYLSDMRISNSYQSLRFANSNNEKKSFVNDMINNCSSVKFLNNGKHIIARDYMSVKLWDTYKTDKPVACIMVQEALKSKLCEIIQNNYIYDKFSICASKDSNTVLTGNYNNSFHLIDVNDLQNCQYQINYKKDIVRRRISTGKNKLPERMDYSRKIAACDFNPKRNIFAVASLNSFLTYTS